MRDSPRHLVRYRIVDDRDGRVLAEYADAEEALRSFGRLAGHPHVRARVSVVVLEHEPAAPVGRNGTASVASVNGRPSDACR